MTKLNRRQAVAAIAMLGVFNAIPAEPAQAFSEAEPDYPDLALLMARWELSAVKHGRPKFWRRMRYTGIARWGAGVLLYFGIGPPGRPPDDLAWLLRWLDSVDCGGLPPPSEILGIGTAAAGRGWAVMVRSPAVAVGPAWKRSHAASLDAFERSAGRQYRRSFQI
ncbi:MAG TPA: hypothetical protein VIK18_07130 [Pirellulales bacterium]